MWSCCRGHCGFLVECGFVGDSLGWVSSSVGPCGWLRLLLWLGCCEGLDLGFSCGFWWVVWFASVGEFGFGLGLGVWGGLGSAKGQTVPDQ